MSMHIWFGRTTKPYNCGVGTPTVTDIQNVEVLLKENTSIQNPTYILNNTGNWDVSLWNYGYSATFHRYYYIDTVVYRTASVVEITCVCDVLTSFYVDLIRSSGYIEYSRNPSTRAFIADSRYPKTHESETTTVTQTGFNALAKNESEGCYIIGVASEGVGMNQAFCTGPAGLAALAAQIYSVDSWMDVSQNNEHYYKHPDEALFYCRWVPFTLSQVRGESGTMSLNGVELAGDFYKAKQYLDETISVGVECKYRDPETGSCRDFRNVEPYAEWTMKLPGVGIFELPMYNLIGDGSSDPEFDVKASYSLWTGNITYQIIRMPDNVPVLIMSASMGVDIPISHFSNATSLLQTAANIGSTVTNSVVQIDMSKALHNVSKGISTASCAVQVAAQCAQLGQTTRTASGSLNGISYPHDEINNVEIYTVYHPPTENEHLSTFGYPVFKWDDISNHCLGFIKMGAVHLHQTYMTAEEQSEVIDLLMGGCFLYDQYKDPSESE